MSLFRKSKDFEDFVFRREVDFRMFQSNSGVHPQVLLDFVTTNCRCSSGIIPGRLPPIAFDFSVLMTTLNHLAWCSSVKKPANGLWTPFLKSDAGARRSLAISSFLHFVVHVIGSCVCVCVCVLVCVCVCVYNCVCVCVACVCVCVCV